MNIPKKWEELTIKQYLNVSKIKFEGDHIGYSCDLLSAITDIDTDEILKLDINTFNNSVRQLSFLNNFSCDEKIRYSFSIDGYKFEANLKIETYKTSDYIDIINYCKEENTMVNMHKMLAIVFVQTNKKNDLLDNNKKSELFYENMDLGTAYPVFVFFCNLLNNLMPNINLYLKNQQMKIMKEAKEIEILLKNDGVGI